MVNIDSTSRGPDRSTTHITNTTLRETSTVLAPRREEDDPTVTIPLLLLDRLQIPLQLTALSTCINMEDIRDNT
jgi:hypothetical protein